MKKITLKTSSVYRYNLYDEIESFSSYNDFVSELANMTSNDSVALYINCPGGRVDVGLSLINSIQSSYANITAVVEGPSYSMASIIALACDKLLMLDNTFLMYHNYSTVGYGKGGELMNSMKHSDDHFNRLMHKVCSPFLTKAELNKIASDQDIYIYSDDPTLDKRRDRHFK
jgi:ATP-dependent protease ClpP protease subunit